MRRRSGRPSASFMRSASGMVWSCHGALVVVIAGAFGSREQPGNSAAASLGDSGGDAAVLERDQPGEEAVEPGALLGRERRGLRNERRDRRTLRDRSFDRLPREQRFERVDLVPAREGQEAFLARWRDGAR